jgi:hypothetical protein
MNIINFAIIFVVIFNICVFIWAVDFIITQPIIFYVYGTGDERNKEWFIWVYEKIMFLIENFPKISSVLYVLVNIFFIIMYGIYLIIKYVIPDTGFPTLFIPIKELLLKIFPLPDLEQAGIFRFYDAVVSVFYFPTFEEKIKNLLYEYYLFSKNGTIEVIKIFNPSIETETLETTIIETLKNYNRDEKYKKIEKDVNVCISNNIELTQPNATYIEDIKANINNIKTNIDCNMKSIGSYISTDI